MSAVVFHHLISIFVRNLRRVTLFGGSADIPELVRAAHRMSSVSLRRGLRSARRLSWPNPVLSTGLERMHVEIGSHPPAKLWLGLAVRKGRADC